MLKFFKEILAHSVNELPALLILALEPLHLGSDLSKNIFSDSFLVFIGAREASLNGEDAVKHSRCERRYVGCDPLADPVENILEL